jgi:hypothetical protein
LWRTTRLIEVRAAIRLVIDGMRNPNFIYFLRYVISQALHFLLD